MEAGENQTAVMSTTAETPKLSPRELEIMRLVARGDNNMQIADALGISHHTVNNHLRRIYLKTGSHSRVQAACTLCFADPRQLSLPNV
jgi:LuxR family transcriptional regulator, maltose regulon positive regulatory protein